MCCRRPQKDVIEGAKLFCTVWVELQNFALNTLYEFIQSQHSTAQLPWQDYNSNFDQLIWKSPSCMSLLLLVTDVFFHNKIFYLGYRISFLSKQKTELNNVDIMCSPALYSNSLCCYLSYPMSTLSNCTWSAAEFDSFKLANL